MTFFAITNIMLTLMAVGLLMPIAVFCLECFAAMLWSVKSKRNKDADERPSVCLLIPAHNEQLVIEKTLGTIQKMQDSTVRIFVVADNCEDRTAELAANAGAEVLVRHDPIHRGKGHALQAGMHTMRANPPDVVVIMDADCVPEPFTIETLAQAAWTTQRPVQSLNLTDRREASGPFEAISLLANRFTNLIRPLGLKRLGLPCRLMGTGMAIPWSLASHVDFAGSSLVEDMQLGINLALRGHLPLFCPEARVSSALPPAKQAFVSQRTRWDCGHLHTATVQVPRILAAAAYQRSWSLFSLACDLCIPPLTFLVALWLGAVILAGANWWFGGAWLPVMLLLAESMVLGVALGIGWAVFCRRQVPLAAFAAVPLYMFRKMPIYLGLLFRRQQAWVRTDRVSDV